MGDLAIAAKQARYSLLETVRNARVLVFTIVFPVVLLVLFNSIFTSDDNTVRLAGGTVSTEAYFTAGILGYAIMMSAFSTMAIGIVAKRESGGLKRMRGTPMAPWTFIAAEIVRSIVLVVVMAVLLLLIGHLAFDVAIPGEGLVGLVVYVALGTASLAALGIAITVFLPNADAASTVAPFSAVILAFISGVFIPVSELPNWLEEVGRIFPLYHVAEGLQTTLVEEGGGTGLEAGNVAVLALWGLAGIAIAARRFRWEPQSR